MARQLTDLEELYSNELNNSDYMLVRDESSRNDKKITVGAIKAALNETLGFVQLPSEDGVYSIKRVDSENSLVKKEYTTDNGWTIITDERGKRVCVKSGFKTITQTINRVGPYAFTVTTTPSFVTWIDSAAMKWIMTSSVTCTLTSGTTPRVSSCSLDPEVRSSVIKLEVSNSSTVDCDKAYITYHIMLTEM